MTSLAARASTGVPRKMIRSASSLEYGSSAYSPRGDRSMIAGSMAKPLCTRCKFCTERIMAPMAYEVPVTQARAEFADLVNRVVYGGERVVVTRHGKPIVALVPAADLERLESDHPEPAQVIKLGSDGGTSATRGEPARRPLGIAAEHRPPHSSP